MADNEVEGSDLNAIIADELRQSQTFDQTKRALALEYVRGVMSDLPARPNGSSQTTRVVGDAVSWVLPGTVRVYTASDQMVEFEATQEGGEQAAEEASEYTNYSFFRENDGYRILYTATHDALLLGNGAACSYWCPDETETKTFRNKTEEEIAALLDEGWQGAGKPPTPGAMRTIDDPMTGAPMEVQTINVKLQKLTERGHIDDKALKPENLLLNGTATTIDDARFVAYLHDDKTRSDLMEMAGEYGWDTEVIRNLPRYTQRNTNEVGLARLGDQLSNDTSPTKSGDLIDLYECYIRVDKDGDGEAELLQVWYAGSAGRGNVLSDDEWEDDVPFTDIPCYPVPHQWQAEGLYDRLADIQRVTTTLLRQAIDNTYAVNFPMREVEAGSVENPDILVNPRFGGIIWRKKGAQSPIVPHVIPYTADKSFIALQMMEEYVTKRTGISKATMALDPEALQNQTATASQNQRDAGYSQIELIARNMAELGWSKFFAKRRNLAKKYIKGTVAIPSKNGDAPPPPDQMAMDGQQAEAGKPSSYRTVQPEAWGDAMACTINVGLGTGSRDRDMAMLGNIQQDQMIMAGLLRDAGFANEAIDFVPKIIKTATQKAESAGLKNPDSYYPAMDEKAVAAMKEAAAQPKPNPQVELEKAKLQISVESEKAKAEANVQKEAAQMQADLATTEQTQNFEREKFNAEYQLKVMTLAQQRELELLKLGMTERDMGDGTGKPVDATASMLMDGMQKLGDALQMMSAHMSAPTEIVRDPQTGKAIGARKVVN